MRFSVDSNILVYAMLRDDEEKHRIASDIMIRAMLLDCVIPVQVLGEFLNVVRRKLPKNFDRARAQASRWCQTITIVATDQADVLGGAEWAAKHNLQLWDSIIFHCANRAKARLFLSEDMQDGFSASGTSILNPFVTSNQQPLRDLLSSADHDIDWTTD